MGYDSVIHLDTSEDFVVSSIEGLCFLSWWFWSHWSVSSCIFSGVNLCWLLPKCHWFPDSSIWLLNETHWNISKWFLNIDYVLLTSGYLILLLLSLFDEGIFSLHSCNSQSLFSLFYFSLHVSLHLCFNLLLFFCTVFAMPLYLFWTLGTEFLIMISVTVFFTCLICKLNMVIDINLQQRWAISEGKAVTSAQDLRKSFHLAI